MFARLQVGWAVAIVLMATGCAAGPQQRDRQSIPGSPVWTRATPESQGMDPRAIAKADRLARTAFKGVTSVLAARHGRLIVERYYQGVQASSPLPVFSITKTFVSSLVGIALDQRKLRDVDQSLSVVLPETGSRVTIRELLSMTAGYGHGLNFEDTDPAALANRPLVNKPGTTFNYDSGSSDLLAAILQRATGISAAQYAQRRLFAPLGIGDARWPSSRGGSGLSLRARDLLAFGQMYLDDGRWRGKRVVPANWVHASTQTQVPVPPGHGVTAGYGFNWWIDEHKPRFFAAHGYLGQALVVFPRLDLVVVVTSSRDDLNTGFAIAQVIAKAARP